MIKKKIISEHVKDALSKGAKLHTGIHPDKWNEKTGLFIPPMIIANVSHDMKIMKEETFGPVLPVSAFDNKEEAISMANDSSYGLSASIWSKDIEYAQKIASKLIYGNVVINDVIINIANHNLPYGGEKQSGLGRYNGEIGLESFCRQVSVMVDRGKKRAEVNWFPYEGKMKLFSDLTKSYMSERRNWIEVIKSYVGLMKK